MRFNRLVKYFLFCFCLAVLASCDVKQKHNIVFYGTDDGSSSSIPSDSVDAVDITSADTVWIEDDVVANTVSVPFTERGGVKYIEVTVNGEFTVPMILDSGCSTTLISIAEARYLYEKGCFTQDDILGVAPSQIADGSIVNNMVINLHQIVIGDAIVCHNVTATVSENSHAPLLLGNDVLDRAPSYSVDNVNHQVVFKLN